MKNTIRPITLLLATTCLLGSAACQRKEKVLDVKTPGGGIEVERDKKTEQLRLEIESFGSFPSKVMGVMRRK